MELGIGMFGDLPKNQQTQEYQPVKDRYEDLIEQIKLADRTGIDVFLMGEHHRPDYAVSAPEIALAALSTVTEQITLASGVTVLSSADPVKVYQDFSMLDLLSHHRSEIVAGRGSFIESFPLFGYDLKDYDALFDEKLDLLVRLNKKESVTWEGEFRASLKDQTVYPRPGRELPLWIAVGGTPASVVRAAKYGIPIIFAIIGGHIQQFEPLINLYKDKYKQFGHDPDKMEIAVHGHTFVAGSQEQVMNDYYPYYKEQMDRIGRERNWPPYTKTKFENGMSPEGALFMGDSDQVVDKMIDTIESFGLTRFVAHIDVGAPNHKAMMDTIERYGKQVLPKVRETVGG